MSLPTPCGSLHLRTLELVKALPRDITLTQVASGAGLPLAWLTAFCRGDINAPNVNRVQRLWEYLTGRKLGVD